jgi:hypothetical protein
MQPLMIDAALAEHIKATADAQNVSVDDFLRQLLQNYNAPQDLKAADAALDAMEGMFTDADVTDMSTTVRETMEAYYREKFGNDDSD